MLKMSSKVRESLVLLGVGALVLSLAACAGREQSSGTAGQDGVITFGVTNPQLPGSAYYASVPDYLGFWSDQGLKVDFQPFHGSGDVMTAVATGKTLIGSGGTKSTMTAIANGNADTRVFYSYIPNNPYWPVVLPDSPIQSLEDLEGKTVGTFSLSGDGAGLLKGVMRSQGLDTESMKIVEVGTGAEAMQALTKGRIDAYMGYDSVYGQIEALGYPLRRIDSEIDDYGFMGGIVATADTLKNQRDLLVKFGRGLAMAAVFTTANPECALRIQWKSYPETKPTNIPEIEAVAKGVDDLMSRLKNQKPVDGQWGRVAQETVQKRIDIALEEGALTEPMSAQEVWAPEILDAINDFDTAQIEQQARTCNVQGLS